MDKLRVHNAINSAETHLRNQSETLDWAPCLKSVFNRFRSVQSIPLKDI